MIASLPRLEAYERIWRKKKVLRAVYDDFAKRLIKHCRPGRTLEIGAGGASLKYRLNDLVSSDIQQAPWLDVIIDAHVLPFAKASFDNIAMIDVLHHLSHPRRFLTEAARCLRPGGRVLLLEPAVTPASRIIYGLFHPERIDMTADPFSDFALCKSSDPYDANMAIPTLMFDRRIADFHRNFPEFHIFSREWFAFFVYPFSGGYRSFSLIPHALARPLLKMEYMMPKWLGRLLAMRLLAVLARRNG